MIELLYIDFPLTLYSHDYHRIKDMYNHVSERSGLKAPLIADDVYEIIMKVLIWQTKILDPIAIEFLFLFKKKNVLMVCFPFDRILLVSTVKLYMIETLTMITLVLKPLKGLTCLKPRGRLLKGLSTC